MRICKVEENISIFQGVGLDENQGRLCETGKTERKEKTFKAGGYRISKDMKRTKRKE